MNNRGFTFVELLITMIIVSVVIALTGETFGRLVQGLRSESKSVEASLDKLTGVEKIRLDMEHVGFGVPIWTTPAKTAQETAMITWTEDVPSTAALGAPTNRLLQLYSTLNSTNAGSMGWAMVTCAGPAVAPVMVVDRRDATATNNVVLLDGDRAFQGQGLITGNICPTFGLFSAFPNTGVDCLSETAAGLGNCTKISYSLRALPASITTCAPNTYELARTVGAGAGNAVLTCVADFIVRFDQDTTGNGSANVLQANTPVAAPVTNQRIVSQLKNIDMFILVQSGPRDPQRTFAGDITMGGTINFANNIVPAAEFPLYDWKVIHITSKPMSW